MKLDMSFAENALHKGIETFGPIDSHLKAKAKALYVGWSSRFLPVLEEHEILEVESEFSYPLLNPETESPSRTFVEAGKIDGILRSRRSGVVKVLEHKTTSDSIASDSDYWPRLQMDTQASKYILNLRRLGHDTNVALYDVIHKPAQRPKNIPLLDENGLKIVLGPAGNRITTGDGKKWRQTGDTELGYVLQTTEESPAEFCERLLNLMDEKPTDFFVQREIPRSDSDLLEYMNDAWAITQTLLYFKKHKLWPRNPSACTQYGQCEFFDLCAGRAEIDGIRFRAKPNTHAELQIQSHGNLELLTNSRLSALRKCARFHYLKYEEPTEKCGEVSEALALGTLFHVVAEHFLKEFVVSK